MIKFVIPFFIFCVFYISPSFSQNQVLNQDSLYWNRMFKNIFDAKNGIYSSAFNYNIIIKELDSILFKNPTNKSAIRLKVQLYSHQEKYDSSIIELNKRIHFLPNDYELYMIRGGLYEIKRKQDMANVNYSIAKSLVLLSINNENNEIYKLKILKDNGFIDLLLMKNKEVIMHEFDSLTSLHYFKKSNIDFFRNLLVVNEKNNLIFDYKVGSFQKVDAKARIKLYQNVNKNKY